MSVSHTCLSKNLSTGRLRQSKLAQVISEIQCMVVQCDLHKYGSVHFLDTSVILAKLEEEATAVPCSAHVQVRGQRTWAKQFSFKAKTE